MKKTFMAMPLACLAAFGAETPIVDLSFNRDEIRTTAQTARPAPPLATNRMTVAYWAMPLDRNAHNCSSRWENVAQRVVASDGSGYFDGFRTGMTGTSRYVPYFQAGDAKNPKLYALDLALPSDKWAHVAWTWDITNLVGYVNGERRMAFATPPNWTPPQNGRFVVGPAGYGVPPLPMKLQDLRVWDRPLAPAEVEAMAIDRFPERKAALLTERGRWAEAREIYAGLDDWKAERKPYMDVEPRRPVAPPPATAHSIFVSPSGDDTAAGTLDAPLKSWNAAVRRVRELVASGAAGGVTVFFRGGEYRVAETVRLEKADSGRPDFPVVYTAYGDERPVFTGLADLDGWKPVTDAAVLRRLPTDAARAAVRVCDLRKAGVQFPANAESYGWGFAEASLLDLYVDGERQLPARYPNDSFLRATNVVDKTNCVFRGDSAVGDMADWALEPELMGCGYWVWCWADFTVPLKTDVAANTFTIAPKLRWPMAASWNPNMFYFICNALRAVDREGEWHLDRTTGLLYAWVKPGRRQISVFDRPFLEMRSVSHVQIRGVELTGGRGRAVVVSDCSDVLFARNRVTNFGGEGFRLSNARDVVVWGNVFSGFGCAAMDVSGGDRRSLTASGIRIENNEIAHSSRHVRTYTPGMRLHGCGTKVVYNHFHDILSSAMRLEGNDFLISMNVVEDVVKESGDQGGVDIYNNPSYQGNVYSFNVWRNIGCGGHGQAGIRFDDRISGQVVYGNRFDNCSDGKFFGAVQINGGRRNTIDNNVFTRCAFAVSAGGYDGEHWRAGFALPDIRKKCEKDVNIYAPPYTTRYPGIETLKDELHQVNRFTRNVFVGAGRMLKTSGWDSCARNWRFAVCPDLDAFARETCFSPLPPVGEIGTYSTKWTADCASEECPAVGGACTANECRMPIGASCMVGGARPDVQAKTEPFFAGDLHEALDQAERDGKVVVMSLGRKACTRCLKFYALHESGDLKFDPTKCIYVKLLVDDSDHKQTFLSFCAPEDTRLPFLGVYDPSTGAASCRSGGGTLDECRAFFKSVLLP